MVREEAKGEKQMTNNDLLIRLRYALDIKDTDMVEIFRLGGIDVTKEDVRKILSKPSESEEGEIFSTKNEDFITCNYKMLDGFLNGFVTFKRGKQEPKPGQSAPAVQSTSKKDKPNNLFMKKVKVALSLTTEDILDIFNEADVTISKGELGAILRKPDHRNYKECLDSFVRKFLKGLTLKYRNEG